MHALEVGPVHTEISEGEDRSLFPICNWLLYMHVMHAGRIIHQLCHGPRDNGLWQQSRCCDVAFQAQQSE